MSLSAGEYAAGFFLLCFLCCFGAGLKEWLDRPSRKKRKHLERLHQNSGFVHQQSLPQQQVYINQPPMHMPQPIIQVAQPLPESNHVLMNFTLPMDAKPNQQLPIAMPDGTSVNITVPPNVAGGEVIQVNVAMPPAPPF